ncbi:unnamed protein product [Rotaria sp. Silwood1]|nr:unnamed protein product [Rotaria sp. Silwood1]CAF1097635.1 unnamed protein product [Rotaria sp. Silwood1]CAF3456538.1 unnamed protein product [Rotaria sp. Silwood1]CAF4738081.1 unnamed protein product [Rotaria sp. Silwood1]
MKFFITFLIITLIIIDGILCIPIVHSTHVQTVSLYPVVTSRTSRKPIVSSDITVHTSKHSSEYGHNTYQSTNSISSSSPSTTHYHPSWWYNQNSAGRIILRVFLYAIAFAVVSTILGLICNSKKQQSAIKNNRNIVLKNKMYVSTISGKREEQPPTYAEVHKV